MSSYRIYQIDSFTREVFRGNPAGVVPHAEGLTDVQMQQIARELNNSETAFILSSNDPRYDVEVRFFTPTAEVPFAVMRRLPPIMCGRLKEAVRAGISKKQRQACSPLKWFEKMTTF